MIEGKTFLVTGSSSGIGKSITNYLINEGANVVGVSKSDFSLDNKNYQHYKFDLSQIDKNFIKFVKILKQDNFYGLISNAGYGEFESLENFSDDQINRFISLNLNSHILLTKYILPFLKKNRSGYLIYMGSEATYKSGRYGSLYSACKFGLRGFVKSIRKETSNKNIKVSLLNPGIVNTTFYNKLKISPGNSFDEFIEPNDISKLIIDILKSRDGIVIDEINLSSQKYVINFKNKKN